MSRGRFERRRLSIPAGTTRPTSPDEWSDAVVLVTRGSLEVICVGGASARFGAGSLLALGWLPVAWLRSAGTADIELLAVRRRTNGMGWWWADVPVTRWTMAMAALARGAEAAIGQDRDGFGVDG